MLCDSGNYIVEPSIEAPESDFDKMPSSEPLKSSSPSLIDPEHKSSFDRFTSTSGDYGINRAKPSKHPNINHHPTIHPHSRYQRTLLNTLNRNSALISENNTQPNDLNQLDQVLESFLILTHLYSCAFVISLELFFFSKDNFIYF